MRQRSITSPLGFRKFVGSSRTPSLHPSFSESCHLFHSPNPSVSSQSLLDINITAFNIITATPQAVYPSLCSSHRAAPELCSFIHHSSSMISDNGFLLSGSYGAITAHVQHQYRVRIAEKLLLDTVHSSHPYHDNPRRYRQEVTTSVEENRDRSHLPPLPIVHRHAVFPRRAHDQVPCQLEGSAPIAMPIPSVSLTLGSEGGLSRCMKN